MTAKNQAEEAFLVDHERGGDAATRGGIATALAQLVSEVRR
jgi:hypothetical protein